MKTHLDLPRPVFRAVIILTTLLVACAGLTKAQVFPDPPETENGSVTVTLLPPGIASGWHFVGEQIWRDSGAQATGLVLGERKIEFRPVRDYIQPVEKKINLTSSNAAISLTREYYQTPGGKTGRLTVILKPAKVAAPSINESARAQWRLLGEGDGKWRDSGDSRNLLPGVYLVESKPVSGKTTPRPVTVKVLENESPTATATYFVKDAEAGDLPSPVDFSAINDPNLPYAYVGLIRTSHSSGTGCVVLSNTVVTAAHLIFDEDKLTYFGGLQWLFQRHKGSYSPVPQKPQRVGILTSYSAQRAIDDSPGKSSARSRSCDVAALYFTNSPGRNGFAGYQFSDNPANEYLTSSNLKTLACYPIEGIAGADLGKMHATTPSNVTFTANPPFPDLTANDTYFTTDITSTGGAAGGPVFVKNGGSGYDCVAIYLGGSAKTEVRAFTEDVDTLFLWANTDGEAPDGGITTVNGPGTGGSFNVGAIKIKIKPASGRWRLGNSTTTRASGAKVSNLLAGTYTINFTKVAGYKKPSPISVVVSNGKTATKSVKYTSLGPVTRITAPENNASVSREGFHVSGTASDPSGIRKYEVQINSEAATTILPGETYFSGKTGQDVTTIKMRAKSREGVWGDYTSITVKAK